MLLSVNGTARSYGVIPNVSVYPDTNQVGIFDAAARASRRFGALFNVADAASDYGRGRAEIVPPADTQTRDAE
jgi:hypothetical protein